MFVKNSIFILVFSILAITGCSQNQNQPAIKNQRTMKFKQLTPEEERVIVHKGTEAPFTGKYEKFSETGT